MGLFHGHKRDVDAEKHLKRLHKTVPIIESPLSGADHDHLVFSQRHEANSVELFFDLFFVANLATFTTYHSVTDTTALIAYVGFFGILWSSWFQVTLHDVRFARDSIYERVCKTGQFIVFVGLALVGSSFNPGKNKGQGKSNNTNFRILCYTLVISRGLLTIQYCVVLFYTFRARYSKIYLPVCLHLGIYALAAIAFGAMTPAFRENEQAHTGIYVIWYVVMLLEGAAVLTISCFWRMLSFKKTHLMERMSLLTLIVIGEGAIGVTKTVSRMMGKSGLDVEGCFLIMCIIVILVLIWALYFDNFPHGHYGTIRQQFWSVLHFPLQLSIVGVVEGSQQLALARYVVKNYKKVDKAVDKYCFTEHLDGAKLRDKLLSLLEYWQFEKKLETYFYQEYVEEIIYDIGNTTNICSATNVTEYSNENWPFELYNMTMGMFDGVYTGLGVKLPVDKLERYSAAEIAIMSWRVVYLYYWISFCILILCFILFLVLIRRHRSDAFDYVSIISRLLVLGVGFALVGLIGNDTVLYTFIESPAVLPTCVVFLFLILLFDKLASVFCNWRLKKSGEPYAKEHDEEHHHHGGDGHGQMREQDPHHEPLATVDHRKSARWSTYSDAESLIHNGTEYRPHGSQDYSLGPMSPPLVSPPLTSPSLVSPSLTGTMTTSYMPVVTTTTTQHQGA
ncbi:hypothetical protein B0J11DRAFT_100205 [Dendryphion nanum]|uniref:Low temperature requirement A n=1 Tax=Dendryphion nanum TaxID=256645 RepID=A0A9P9DAD2_9PLEO|nr:hypothetical protein B0J11DRAFT_100205 [Dendryphion nanum]